MKIHPKYKYDLGQHVSFKNKWGRTYTGIITDCEITLLNRKSGAYEILYRIKIDGFMRYYRLIEEELVRDLVEG